MALWGTADGLNSPGTVSVNYNNKTITGSGTSFTSSGIAAGTVITIGAGGTFGSAVISGITSDTLLTIATTQYLSGAAIAGVGYTLSQRPVYTLEDSNYGNGGAGAGSTIASIYGVDIYEAQSNVTTQYAVTHAGWVGIKTYVDSEGNLRVKSETLVAMSGITTNVGPTYGAPGDAADDAVFPDRLITITTQPSNRTGISTTSATTFAVVASVDPSASLSYQWQYSSTGIAYTNLSNGGIYSNVTTATVGIAATTVTANRPNGFYYRAVITADGGATATSSAARLTYA
jgi:hypothetical protein